VSSDDGSDLPDEVVLGGRSRHLQALELGAEPHVGEQLVAVLVKVKERLRPSIEDATGLLPEPVDLAKPTEKGLQSIERVRSCMTHIAMMPPKRRAEPGRPPPALARVLQSVDPHLRTFRGVTAPVSRRRAVRRLWSEVKDVLGEKTRLLWVLLAVSIVGGFSEAGLLYAIVRVAVALANDVKHVDLAMGPLPDLRLSIGAGFTIALVCLGIMTTLSIVEARISARLATDALTDARKRLFRAFTAASWEGQSTERDGRLQELMTTYVMRLAQAITTLAKGLVAMASFLTLLGSAFVVDFIPAAISLLAVALLYLLLRPINSRTKVISRQSADENVAYASRIAESVALAREVHVFHVGDEVVADVDAFADVAALSAFKTRWLGNVTPSLYQSAAMLLLLIGLIGVYWGGPSRVAELAAVVLLLVRSLTYSQQVQTVTQQAAEIAPYVEGLREQLVQYESMRVDTGGKHINSVGTLELSRVSFRYEPEVPVLSDITFSVRPGESIGIVGPSGAGKSTLVQLLLRLRHPDAGTYRVGGMDALAVDPASWYKHFAFVPQDNKLLYGTVAQNIAFYRLGITRSDVEEASRRAQLDDDVRQWPEGYDTAIGHGAQDLSGGQLQRLALARALVGRPSVLILDEPTSALDLRSERLVQRTLEALHGEVTMFIVAHRMSTLSICDRVLVLRDGCVEAFGPPAELRRASGFYQEAMQLLRGSQ
jgi:ATP-binding cassette, subfamily B, bacterial